MFRGVSVVTLPSSPPCCAAAATTVIGTGGLKGRLQVRQVSLASQQRCCRHGEALRSFSGMHDMLHALMACAGVPWRPGVQVGHGVQRGIHAQPCQGGLQDGGAHRRQDLQ